MSNVTSLRMRVLPRFPARITADNGLKIERDNLDLMLKPDFGSLVKVPSIQGADATYFWAWNEQENAYSSISFQNLVSNIQDVVIGDNLAGIDSVASGLNRVPIFVDDEGSATTYAVSDYVQSVSGAVDAEGFLEEIGAATTAQGEKADSAAQEETIGSFTLVKNRADRIWDVKDFSGSSFRSRIENALNEAASSNLLIRVPAGDGNANVIDAPITINSGATFKAGLLGDGMSASKIWCDGVGITMEGTAGSFFNLKDIAFRSLQAGVGTALALNWQAPTTGKGFTIDNVSFGPENASSTQWFDTCLSIANKGSGHIYGCWFQGKSDTDPKGTGIKLNFANDVIVQSTHMYNLEYGARSDGATSLEGFRFVNGIMVRVGRGLWFKSSPTGLPHIEVALSHLNTCYEGIHIEGYSQVNIVDNLLYARNDITVGVDQTDIYLDTCPSATVARNKFYSGMPKASYNKTAIKILGSMRNSVIRDNLASERDVFLDMNDTGILGAQGIQDVVVAKNRSERDTSGNPTVTKMYQITDSALHRRITWEGYRDEFRTDATISAALSLTSGTWTTIPFVPLTATHPDLALKTTATAGELEVPAGVTYATISARARISTASGDAQILGLRIMKDSGSGFSEIYRSSCGGADAEVKLTTGPSELTFVKGDKIRVEAYQNGTGTGSVSANTVWTALSFVPQ